MSAYRTPTHEQEADRSILVIGIKGTVLGLDRATGAIRWENGLPGGGFGDVFLAMRYGCVVASAREAKVFCLDYLTGATRWESPTGGIGRATIIVEPELILVGKGGYVDAFDHDGKRLWSQDLPGKGVGGVALGCWGNVAQSDDA